MSIFGDIASGGVGALLGGIGTLAKDIREAIVGAEMKPEQKVALELKIMELEQASTVAQIQCFIKILISGARGSNRQPAYSGRTCAVRTKGWVVWPGAAGQRL